MQFEHLGVLLLLLLLLLTTDTTHTPLREDYRMSGLVRTVCQRVRAGSADASYTPLSVFLAPFHVFLGQVFKRH